MFKIIFVCVFLCVGESLSFELRCSSYNNEEVSCVKSSSEPTCHNRGVQVTRDVEGCQPKCVCKKGFFRNSIGICITEKQCDQCNEDKNEYYSCGGFCDNVCAELSVQNKTRCPIVNIKCNEKCYCKDGYARNSQNTCVPINECDAEKLNVHKRSIRKGSLCKDPNEEHLSCKKSCPPDTCMSLIARFKCDSREVCKPGCRCKSGFLRQKANSHCIPIKQCSQLAHSPDFN